MNRTTNEQLPYPTLRRVVSLMMQAGIDAISLVREARPDRQPAIGVIMMTQAAIRRLGSPCLAIATRLGDQQGEHKNVMTMDIDANLELGFQWCEQNGFRWSSAHMILDFGGKHVHGSYFVAMGQELCEELAPQLTVRGCPTTLK